MTGQWASRMRAGLRQVIKPGMTTRLILGFCLLILPAPLVFGVVVSTLMAQRMYRSADEDLRSHVNVFTAILKNEENFLADEAVTVANLEGMSAALVAQDRGQLRRLLIPVKISHNLDSMYIVDEQRRVMLLLGDPIDDEMNVVGLPLVERGFDMITPSGPIEANGTLWLVAVAAHRSQNGAPDAVILLAKRLDREYLQSLNTMLGPEIALAWENTAVYSFDPPPSELPLSHLNASKDELAEYRDASIAYHSMQINGAPYRVAAFGFSPRDGGRLTALLFQPTTRLEDSIRIALSGIAALSLAIMLVGSFLAYLYARSVTRPLTQLAYAAGAMARGDLDQPVSVESHDEVGQVARAFEAMRVRIKKMLQEQQEWNVGLEETVRAQTAELRAVCEMRDQLLKQTITAQEEGRRLVARELHDETSQALTALIANLAAAERLTPKQAQTSLGELKAATIKILQEVNQIVLDLRPTLLDDYGLISALTWYAKNRLGNAGARVESSAFGPETRLPPEVETTLFRVGQEAITNIAKHARAQNVQITFLFADSQAKPAITLQIEDDGCGFDWAEVSHRAHDVRPPLGLLGMRERIGLVDGQLEIRSAQGKGTCITVTVPQEPQPGAQQQEG